jgi:hypothetical protein
MSWIQNLPAYAIRRGLANGDFRPEQIAEAERRLTELTVDRPRMVIGLGVRDDRPRGVVAVG